LEHSTGRYKGDSTPSFIDNIDSSSYPEQEEWKDFLVTEKEVNKLAKWLQNIGLISTLSTQPIPLHIPISPIFTIATPTENSKEIKMNTLTLFSREWKKLDNFLLEVEIYQMMNDKVYNTDQKRIIFALSFMKDEVAKIWKQSWWKQYTAENATFGTWEEFKDTLKKSFTPANKEGNVITRMQTASMTGKTADKFIEEFKNWQLQSGVKEDNPPTTLEGWYTTASNLNNQWRKFKAISAHLRGDTDMKKKGLRLPQNELWYTLPTYHDLNAMEDVWTMYRMSLNE